MRRALLHRSLVVLLLALAAGLFWPHPPPTPIDPREARPAEGLVADAIRNLVLLWPLGMLLAANGMRLSIATALGFAVSCAVEGVQSQIPGRHPSVIDVVANTLSTAQGHLLFTHHARWLSPAPSVARRLAGLEFSAAIALLTLGVQTFRLSPAGPTYFAGIRPELGAFERYPGEVRNPTLGDVALEVGPVPRSAAVRDALVGFSPLSFDAVSFPSKGAIAPLLTLHDADQSEVLLFGAQGGDWIVRERRVSRDLGLESPVFRWSMARGPQHTSAELVTIRLERGDRAASLRVGADDLGRQRFTPGRIWTLLVPGYIVGARLGEVLDFVTIALLALPAAYHAKRVLPLAAGFGLALLALPALGPVAAPPVREWLGLGAALAGGSGLARLVARANVGSTSDPYSRANDEVSR